MFFSSWRLLFCYAWLRGLCLHPVLPVAWASLSSTALCISGSLELVLWYCNNFYSNSILFEVRNVVTSLVGLVIVSHLSPKGSGRFREEGTHGTRSKLHARSCLGFSPSPPFLSWILSQIKIGRKNKACTTGLAPLPQPPHGHPPPAAAAPAPLGLPQSPCRMPTAACTVAPPPLLRAHSGPRAHAATATAPHAKRRNLGMDGSELGWEGMSGVGGGHPEAACECVWGGGRFGSRCLASWGEWR
jgi:hypothetical protein